MSGEPQTISLALEGSGINGSQVTTLLANPGSIFDHGAAQGVTLPPYAAWVASVE
jgi:hypothetical protein